MTGRRANGSTQTKTTPAPMGYHQKKAMSASRPATITAAMDSRVPRRIGPNVPRPQTASDAIARRAPKL